MTNDRYLRQSLIDGWDQGKLEKASVGVIGGEALAIETLMALSMMGIGEIKIYDNSKIKGNRQDEFVYYNSKKGSWKAHELERIFKKSNPDLGSDPRNHKMGINWAFLDKNDFVIMDTFAGKSKHDVLVDTTNDPFLERLVLEYTANRRIPVVNASSMQYEGEVKVTMPNKNISIGSLSTNFAGQCQDPVSSGIIGGIVGDEVRRLIMPLPGETIDNLDVFINFKSKNLVRPEDDYQTLAPDYANKNVIVVGTGAIGVHVVRRLSQRGANVLAYDKDTFEIHNSSRQFDYTLADSPVGRSKVKMMEEMVLKYNPDANIKCINGWFEGKLPRGKIHAIFRCTDSFKTSSMLNKVAMENGIPLFYAATAYDLADAYAFVPGQTPDINTVFNVDEFALKSVVPAGCAEEPNPSVGTVNMFAANSAVGLFDLYCAGVEMPKGYLQYNLKEAKRVSFVKV